MYKISWYLTISLSLIWIGALGLIWNRKNLLLILLAIELLFLGTNIFILSISVLIDDLTGQLFGFWILTVAAAESAIGLALLISYYRLRGSIFVTYLTLLKG